MHWQDHLEGMPRYRGQQPTAFDPRGLGLPDQQDWIVAPVSQNRDSGPLDRSNFRSFLKLLGEESEHVETHSFGHWACGWYEIIIVSPNAPTKILQALAEGACALADYPVVDDLDFSEEEEEEANQAWQYADMRERIDMCNRAGVCFLQARHDWYPSTDTGEIRQWLLGY